MAKKCKRAQEPETRYYISIRPIINNSIEFKKCEFFDKEE